MNSIGPKHEASWTVARVADAVAAEIGRGGWRQAHGPLPAEMPVLRLSSEQARRRLGWQPLLDTGEAIAWTVAGYTALLDAGHADWLPEQIARYETRLHGVGSDLPCTLDRPVEIIHAHA